MRYTTIIDLREFPKAYKNPAVRLLYLHMCLSCGYHDKDRGKVVQSIRAMAADTGLTVGAVRNALQVLTTCHLATKYRGSLYVRTYVQEDTITKPSRKAKTQEQAHREAQQQALEANIEASKQGAVSREEWLQMRKNSGPGATSPRTGGGEV